MWEGEEGATRRWTYAELRAQADGLAHLLAGRGVRAGDAVGIYLPLVPETTSAGLEFNHRNRVVGMLHQAVDRPSHDAVGLVEQGKWHLKAALARLQDRHDVGAVLNPPPGQGRQSGHTFGVLERGQLVLVHQADQPRPQCGIVHRRVAGTARRVLKKTMHEAAGDLRAAELWSVVPLLLLALLVGVLPRTLLSVVEPAAEVVVQLVGR